MREQGRCFTKEDSLASLRDARLLNEHFPNTLTKKGDFSILKIIQLPIAIVASSRFIGEVRNQRLSGYDKPVIESHDLGNLLQVYDKLRLKLKGLCLFDGTRAFFHATIRNILKGQDVLSLMYFQKEKIIFGSNDT